MQPWLSIACTFLVLNTYSQEPTTPLSNLRASLNIDTVRDENAKFRISSIIKTDTALNMEKVYEKAKEVLYKIYGSGDAVIQYSSKDEGKLYCRAVTSKLTYMNLFARMDGGRFAYELTVLCKDGRARVLITNITHEKGAMVQMRDGSDYGDEFPSTWGKMAKAQSAKEWKKMKEQAMTEFLGVISAMKKALTGQNSDENF